MDEPTLEELSGTDAAPDGESAGQRWAIETNIKIGVTGHREFIRNSGLIGLELETLGRVVTQLIRSAVQEVLRELDGRAADTPHRHIVISPLAEGADRIVAQEVLAWPGNPNAKNVLESSLECCLPMIEAEYVETFSGGADSIREYEKLKRAAAHVEILPEMAEADEGQRRKLSFRAAGRYVVEHCDVLIAVWDGEPGDTGGTGEVVTYARQNGRVLYWIHQPRNFGWRRDWLRHVETIRNCALWQEDAQQLGRSLYSAYVRRCLLRRENLNAPVFLSWGQLNAYNNERHAPDTADVARRYRKLLGFIEDQTFKAYFEKHFKNQLVCHVLPHLSEATALASHYQRRYMGAGTAVYILAATAVTTVALITTFFRDRYYGLFWLEVAQVSALLALLWWSDHFEWHRKWIDYRFLAERLRAAVFLNVAGMECDVSATPAFLALSDRPGLWMSEAFVAVWAQLSCGDCAAAGFLLPMRRFVQKAWLEDQITWYQKRSAALKRTDHVLARTGETLFALTLMAALFHALGLGHETTWSNVLTASAVMLPSAGAACSGIRIYREYRRNAERYKNLAAYLSALNLKLEEAGDLKAIQEILREADHAMLREHQGWRAIIGIPPPPPG
jgi:hypothetical protein